MTAGTRRALGLGALIGAVALVLWSRTGPAPGDTLEFRATLEASRSWTGPIGTVPLLARVEVTSDGTADPAAYDYTWTAAGGHVTGRGANAVWVAPAEPGRHEVMVEVRHRASDQLRTAAVDLEVRRFVGMSDDSVPIDQAPELTGYTIDEVSFDKETICANDDVVVTVSAGDPLGGSEWVVPVVKFPGHTSSGFQTVARVGVSYLDDPTPRDSIRVDLMDLRSRRIVATRDVPFRIEPCEQPSAGLRLRCNPEGAQPEEIVCRATLWDPDGFAPVRYEWDVVDEGIEAVTSEQPWVRLELPRRVQTAAVESYVIRGRAFDADGKQIEGRTSHVHHNAQWETASMTGLLELKVRFDGHPRRVGDAWITRVELYNPFAEPVALDAIEVTRYPCEGDEAAARPDPPQVASAVLGAAVLEPGHGVSYDWTMPADPDRCGARAILIGEGAESGLPATALWMMPTDPRARVAVRGEQRDRLRKALQVLSERRGEPVRRVTEIELADLAREGLIDPAPAPADDGRMLEPGESVP